jgi:menaquinol-cytochrome c reductase iron-sulfur subunit
MKPHKSRAQPDRRSFFKEICALVLGAVSAAVPLTAGLAVLFDPLRRKAQAGDFLAVTSLSALPTDGTPRRFPVIADRADAWNKIPRVPVGAVYLRRVSEHVVEALNVTCPHAGCAVEYKPGPGSFLCPCHDSQFNPDGTLVAGAKSPSPRAMDSLDVQIRNGTEVWVRYQNFEAGKAKKIPLT